jgi:hypothetical protein
MNNICIKVSVIAYAIVMSCADRLKETMRDERGGDYVDLAVKILIAVVIGALLLAGLYLLWKNVVLPRLNDEIIAMFNYSA